MTRGRPTGRPSRIAALGIAPTLLLLAACGSNDGAAESSSSSSSATTGTLTGGGEAGPGGGGAGTTTGIGAAGGTGGAATSTSSSGGAGVGATTGTLTGGGAGWPTPPPDYCGICSVSGGSPLQNLQIAEASGIAPSGVHAGIFYVNNDSGDLPRFFAVDASGADQGTFTLDAAQHDDYEEIAVGPCSVGTCVYVADIGDNDEVRPYYTVYRVPEPGSVGAGQQTLFPTQLKFEYPDGSHNAEVLLIHPFTGEIVVVQRADAGPSGIYRAPVDWMPTIIVTLTKEGEVTPPQGPPTFTGGAVHPLGHGILLRTYTHVFYYAASGPEQAISDTLAGTPCVLPLTSEPKGEAIGWTAAGDGYATTSEGAASPINLVECQE